jgi:lipopolysaccharide transport system ATP-binding protein
VETILHISHWKAGSTWIRRILRQLEPDRFARPPIESWGDPFPATVPDGTIYSCYATREQVTAAGLLEAPRFVVVRDLRDTLVSAYFSFRDTHTTSAIVAPLRTRLQNRRFDAGMIYLMDEFLPRVVAIQRSWADEPVIQYEDLLTDDLAILRQTFAGVGLEVQDERLDRAVRANRFRRQTGRRRGEEAPEHLRKGIAGDWRNHFTDRVSAEFEARFGDLVPG